MEKVEAYELHKLPIFITRGKRNPDIDLRIDSKQSSLLKYYDKKIKEAFISVNALLGCHDLALSC